MRKKSKLWQNFNFVTCYNDLISNDWHTMSYFLNVITFWASIVIAHLKNENKSLKSHKTLGQIWSISSFITQYLVHYRKLIRVWLPLSRGSDCKNILLWKWNVSLARLPHSLKSNLAETVYRRRHEKKNRNRRVENSPINKTRGRFAVKKRSTRSGSCHALGPRGVGWGTGTMQTVIQWGKTRPRCFKSIPCMRQVYIWSHRETCLIRL